MRRPPDISLAFDINREQSQNLALNSVLEDFAIVRAGGELKGI